MLFLFLLGLAKASARVTLNKAATDRFGGGATRLRLRASSGQLLVRFSDALEGEDSEHVCLPLVARQRGGAEAEITLSSGPHHLLNEVLSVLPQRNQRPYALLTPASEGWLVARLYEEDGDPPRAEPHLRMWWSHAPAMPATSAEDPYRERVRAASLLLQEASRRAGKPSKEVLAAREVMREFEAFAREVLPDAILPDLDPTDVRRAADTLYGLADRVERQRGRLGTASSSATPLSDDPSSEKPRRSRGTQ